jgi:hypothetical protein
MVADRRGKVNADERDMVLVSGQLHEHGVDLITRPVAQLALMLMIVSSGRAG